MSSCASSTFEKPIVQISTGALRLCLLSFLLIINWLPAQERDVDDINRLSESSLPHYEIESISIVGNAKTKASIILRELTFKEGEKLTEHELRARELRSQQNLQNTSLFVFVTIGHDILNEKINIHIDVKERWYVWPQPLFEIQDRNFNTWWQTKDMFRINYGMFLTFENMFGLNQSLTLKFRQGYTVNYGFNYRIPYLNKKQTIGLSLGYLYSGNNEVAYKTYGNQLLFARMRDRYARNEHEGKVGVSIRKGLYTKHTIELKYSHSRVADTIVALNPTYFSFGKSSLSYFSLQYHIKHDMRDNKIYPLKGYAAYLSVIKDGLGIRNDADNFSLYSGISRYWNFMPRVYWANHLRARYKLARTPYYYFNRALGYGTDLVRGYEYYVVDGQSFALFKTNIRYQLFKPSVYKVKFLKKNLQKFNEIPYAVYLGAYADAAWVQDNTHHTDNPLSNSMLIGGGVGLDFVTYYDYVLRLEFSMNQMKQKGVYLHFAAPF